MANTNSSDSENWAYHHALAHLKEPVARMKREHARVCREPAAVANVLTSQDAMNFVQGRMQYLTGWAQSAAPVICKELNKAWGARGGTPNRAAIEESCKDFCDLLAGLIEWEKQLAAATDPTGCWTAVFCHLRGATSQWFAQLAYLPEYLEAALAGDQGGQKVLDLTFKSPPQFNAQFNQLIKNAYNESLPFWRRLPFATGALAGALLALSGL